MKILFRPHGKYIGRIVVKKRKMIQIFAPVGHIESLSFAAKAEEEEDNSSCGRSKSQFRAVKAKKDGPQSTAGEGGRGPCTTD